MKKPTYVRKFAVVSADGTVLYACRTRKAGENISDKTNAHLKKKFDRLVTQVVEVTKPLPVDVGERYLNDKPYNIKQLSK